MDKPIKRAKLVATLMQKYGLSQTRACTSLTFATAFGFAKIEPFGNKTNKVLYVERADDYSDAFTINDKPLKAISTYNT